MSRVIPMHLRPPGLLPLLMSPMLAGAEAVPAAVQLCERAAVQPAAAAAGMLQLQQRRVCQDWPG